MTPSEIKNLIDLMVKNISVLHVRHALDYNFVPSSTTTSSYHIDFDDNISKPSIAIL